MNSTATASLYTLITAMLLLGACTGTDNKPDPPLQSRHDTTASIDSAAITPHDSTITLNLPDSLIDGRYTMRDLATDSLYEVLEISGWLVLRSGTVVLDTLSSFAYLGDLYDHSVELFDSAFLTIEGVWRGNSGTGETEVFCVANGDIVKSANYHSHANAVINPGEYSVSHKWLRKPYRLRLTESYGYEEDFNLRDTVGLPPLDSLPWKQTHTLYLDTVHYTLYNLTSQFDSVPRQSWYRDDQTQNFICEPVQIDTARSTIKTNTLTGTFSGIKLQGDLFRVFIDRQWYILSDNGRTIKEQPIRGKDDYTLTLMR
jgi:hypothetical protein